MAAGLIAVLNPLTQIQKSKDAKRKSDLSQIQKALEIYYQDNGRYPASSSGFVLRYRIIRLDGSIADWGTQFQPYMSTLPKDPTGSKKYVYYNTSIDKQTYYLYANLDRGGNDPQACFLTGAPCSSAVSNGVGPECGGNCNYGVSSPNVSP